MWRALLADGRIVTSDTPGATPQLFLDQIVQFDVEHNGGRVTVRPDRGERLIWRRRTDMRGLELRVTHVVGLLDLESGLAFLTAIRPDGAVQLGFVDPVEFTSVEVAA